MFTKLCHLYDFINETVNHIAANHPTEIRCGKGCADCCHAMFDLSLIESCYLAQALNNDPQIKHDCRKSARQAQQQFTQLRQQNTDPAQARIRCPLLDKDNTCRCYGGRPINCRTYGTPTIINGQGHVCGLSGFQKGQDYPTINLAPIQERLYRYSEEIAPGHGQQRFTIAQIILATERFLLPPAKEENHA